MSTPTQSRPGSVQPDISAVMATSDLERAAYWLAHAEEMAGQEHSRAIGVCWFHMNRLRRSLERLAARLGHDPMPKAPIGHTCRPRGRKQPGNKPLAATITTDTQPETRTGGRSSPSGAERGQQWRV